MQDKLQPGLNLSLNAARKSLDAPDVLKYLNHARAYDSRYQRIGELQGEGYGKAIMSDDSSKFKTCEVVLFEEDPVLRMVLAAQLDAAAVSFFAAGNDHQVLESLVQHRPRVLILDLDPSGLSGSEIVKVLRRNQHIEAMRDLLAIVYTSEEISQSERENFSLGITTVFYTKTIKDYDMGQIVKEYLLADQK